MKYIKRFNELYKLVTSQSLILPDLPIMVDGKLVTDMSINCDNGFWAIELKTE